MSKPRSASCKKCSAPFPASVPIGPFTYRIALEPDIFPDESDPGDNCFGYCAPEAQLIRLALAVGGTARSAPALRVTFLHELLHAVDHAYCAKGSLSEDQVTNLAVGLAQALAPWIPVPQGEGR